MATGGDRAPGQRGDPVSIPTGAWGRNCTVALLLVIVGCAPMPRVMVPYDSPHQWPADRPQIRLEGTITLNRLYRSEQWFFFQNTAQTSAPDAEYLRPYGITFAADDIVIADPDRSRVSRIAPDGKSTFSPPDLFLVPIEVAVCNGGIAVADAEAGTVTVLDDSLQHVVREEAGFERPTGLACLGGRIYVAETTGHRITVIEDDGTRWSTGSRGDGPGLFNYPTMMLILPRDNELAIIDSMNFRVQVLDLTTLAHHRSFGGLGDAPGDMPRPKGLALDSRGDLWITDAYLDQVSVYSTDGAYLISIGVSGSDLFNFPAGAASHPDGRIVIVDSLSRRLHVFRRLPQPTGSDR